MGATMLLGAAESGGSMALRVAAYAFVVCNAAALVLVLLRDRFVAAGDKKMLALPNAAGTFLVYQFLLLATVVMVLPFYWMVVTAFKDSVTAMSVTPVWSPSREVNYAKAPDGREVAVKALDSARESGQLVRVVPEENYQFRKVEQDGVAIMKETAEESAVFKANPAEFRREKAITTDIRNFQRAWYRPEESSRGEVNFFTYFLVSLITSIIATAGTLATSALAAFAFARLEFVGKSAFFYVVLATMMVPGQVLLIPNFLILSGLGLLDTYAALVLPWLASVFTIFLLRQFFITIPEDLWDAARIDGASRFRYLWQVVVPLSKPVFITAGIFNFLENWNSLLWPLIVTSSPGKRTLMVGLQNLMDDAGNEFHILMAASCFAILPIVLMFFFLQRFFIEGIARTGLK